MSAWLVSWELSRSFCRLEALCVRSAPRAKRSDGSDADRHGGRELSHGSPRSNIALECNAPSTKEKRDSKDTWRFVCWRIISWR